MTSDDPSADADRGSVLTPDELDITDDERVAEIEDGRFVISSGDDTPSVDDVAPVDEPVPDDAGPAEGGTVDEGAVRDWLADSFATADAHYGFDVTVKVDDDVTHQRLLSDDITVTFENLLTWYAQHVGRDTPIEEVLGILLYESNVPIRYPPASLVEIVDRHDLDADDSIADLFAAIDADNGVVFSD